MLDSPVRPVVPIKNSRGLVFSSTYLLYMICAWCLAAWFLYISDGFSNRAMDSWFWSRVSLNLFDFFICQNLFPGTAVEIFPVNRIIDMTGPGCVSFPAIDSIPVMTEAFSARTEGVLTFNPTQISKMWRQKAVWPWKTLHSGGLAPHRNAFPSNAYTVQLLQHDCD